LSTSSVGIAEASREASSTNITGIAGGTAAESAEGG